MMHTQRDADFSLRKTSDGYDVEWAGLATMHVGTSASFHPHPQANSAVIAKLRRGPAAGVERYLKRSGLAFHASAVAVAGSGILITGESGAGKSTLAAMLVARGAEALADDVAITRSVGASVVIEATERVHMLDGASRSLVGLTTSSGDPNAKVAVTSPTFGSETKLMAFIELQPGPTAVSRLVGMAAMVAVARARLCPPTEEPDRLAEDFENVANVTAIVPVFRLAHGNAPLDTLWDLLSSVIRGRCA